MRSIYVIDTTLRDGSHALNHQITREQTAHIVEGLNLAGVKYIEVSHGDGLAGSSYNYGFSLVNELELIRIAKEHSSGAKIAALLIPGIGTIDDLGRAVEAGAEMIRIATHATEANVAIQHIRYAKQLGLETVGFLMMVHSAEAAEIVEQAKVFEEAGADYVNLADSAGYLVPHQVERLVSALTKAINIPIGFHAHNNLGMALANTIAAINSGAVYVDATCRGLGAGAGNAQHEILVCLCERYGINLSEDLYPLLDLCKSYVDPIMKRPPMIDNNAILLGNAGVYSSFLHHIETAASRFQVSSYEIINRLGKRRIVGGQENIITDVAYEIQSEQ